MAVSERARLREQEREIREFRMQVEFLKKRRPSSRTSSSAIRVHPGHGNGRREAYPVVFMCTMLGASTSGYYDWKTRPLSTTAERHEQLKLLITEVFDANHGTYGYGRVHAVLVRSGVQVGDEVVRQLMRELDLQPCQPRPWRPTTTEADGQHRIP